MIVTVLTTLNAIVLFSLSLLHLYWMFGGGWGYLAAIPTDGNGKRLFTPGPGATFVVAVGLGLFACTNLAFAGWMRIGLSAGAIRLAMTMISLIFLVRSIGNFRYVGFFKSFKTSRFARMDTRVYSPLCLALASTHSLCLMFG